MIYICYGIPKSASTFAFTLANEIAAARSDQGALRDSLPSDLRGAYHENLNEKLPRFLSLIPEDEILVIKTHQRMTYDIRRFIQEGKCKAQISIRDPYDIAMSLHDAGIRERSLPEGEQRRAFTSIESLDDALERLWVLLNDGETWLSVAAELNIPIIDFEQIRNRPYRVARKIGNNIGVNADVDAIVYKYVSDKSRIGEFNKGESGRGRQNIKPDESLPIHERISDFWSKYSPNN